MIYRLGLDGASASTEEIDTTCLPANLCDYTEHGLACMFQNLLPTGPIWDRDKIEPNNGVNKARSTMSGYAAYLGKVFYTVIQNSLWASIRESNPWTAVTTLDDWLDKLKWQDCYGACRDPNLVSMSPFEVMGDCGPIYCAPVYSPDYDNALKSAMVKALYRMRLGFVQNVSAFDFILEPLGARVDVTWKDGIEPEDGKCHPELICLQIVKTTDRLLVPKLNCDDENTYVTAWVDQGCDIPMGIQQFVWPALVAAECILRSMLPMNIKCVLPTPCYNPEEL